MSLNRLSFSTVALLALGTTCDAQTTAGAPPGDSAAVAGATRQLESGEQWFRSACVQCHATAALANPDFRLKWSGKSAFDLFERIRSTMPANRPGTLTQGTYAAIVAYLLQQNGMRSGGRRLSSDSSALASIRLNFSGQSR